MVYDVTFYGAIGNGTTDDRSAIQSANDAAEAAGGGIVYYPPGTYLLGSSVSGSCLTVDNNDVFHIGAGRGISILKLGNSVNAHMINFASTVGGGVRDLEFDGNRDNQTSPGHGIRSSGCDGLEIDDVYIHHSSGYGIGLQEGTIKNSSISNAIVTDTGSDGIDIKNLNDDNQCNKMDNITVKRAGLNTSLSGQTCIDIRGAWRLSNIDCTEFSGVCTSGIRFRPGELNDASGYGGHFSSLVNFYVKASATSGTVGVEIDAYGVQAGFGYVEGCGTAVWVNQREAMIGNVVALGNVDGFVFNDNTLTTDSDMCVASACIARSNSGVGFTVETDRVQLADCISRSNNKGIVIASTASQTSVSGETSNNTVADFQNSGTTTYNRGLINFV